MSTDPLKIGIYWTLMIDVSAVTLPCRYLEY